MRAPYLLPMPTWLYRSLPEISVQITHRCIIVSVFKCSTTIRCFNAYNYIHTGNALTYIIKYTQGSFTNHTVQDLESPQPVVCSWWIWEILYPDQQDSSHTSSILGLCSNHYTTSVSWYHHLYMSTDLCGSLPERSSADYYNNMLSSIYSCLGHVICCMYISRILSMMAAHGAAPFWCLISNLFW